MIGFTPGPISKNVNQSATGSVGWGSWQNRNLEMDYSQQYPGPKIFLIQSLNS